MDVAMMEKRIRRERWRRNMLLMKKAKIEWGRRELGGHRRKTMGIMGRRRRWMCRYHRGRGRRWISQLEEEGTFGWIRKYDNEEVKGIWLKTDQGGGNSHHQIGRREVQRRQPILLLLLLLLTMMGGHESNGGGPICQTIWLPHQGPSSCCHPHWVWRTIWWFWAEFDEEFSESVGRKLLEINRRRAIDFRVPLVRRSAIPPPSGGDESSKESIANLIISSFRDENYFIGENAHRSREYSPIFWIHSFKPLPILRVPIGKWQLGRAFSKRIIVMTNDLPILKTRDNLMTYLSTVGSVPWQENFIWFGIWQLFYFIDHYHCILNLIKIFFLTIFFNI
jgi:hypothetical protein